MRRALGRIAKVFGWACVALLGLAALAMVAGYFASRTEWGHRRLLALVLPRLAGVVDGQVRIGHLGGDLLGGLVLEEVQIDDREGQRALRAARVTLRYNLASLLHRRLRIDEVHIEGFWLRARSLDDGQVNLATLFKVPPEAPAPASPATSKPLTILLRRVIVDGEARWDSPPGTEGALRAGARGRVHLVGHVISSGSRTDLGFEQLAVVSEIPSHSRVVISGLLRFDDSGAAVRSAQVVIETTGQDLAVFAPTAKLRGVLSSRVLADGPLSKLVLSVEMTPPTGTVRGSGTLGLDALPLVWTGRLEVRGFDPGAVTGLAPPGVIDLDAVGQGTGMAGRIDVPRLEVRALGAELVAHGQSDLHGYGFVDLTARTPDLARLKRFLPGYRGQLDVTGKVTRSKEHLSIDARLRGARLAHGSIALGKVEARLHSVDYLGDASLTASGLRASSQRFDVVHLKAHLDRQKGSLHVDGRGPRGATLVLDARGEPLWGAGKTPRGFNATVAAVASNVEPLGRVAVRGHARYAGARLVGDLDVTSAGARVGGTFDLPVTAGKGERVALDLAIKTMPLTALKPLLPARLATLRGTVGGTLRARGTLAKAVLDLQLRAARWQIGEVFTDGKPVTNDTDLTVHYSGNALRAHQHTVLGGGAGAIDSDGSVPLDLRALVARPSRALAQLRASTAFDVGLTTRGLELAKLPYEALGLVERPVSKGVLDADVKLTGSLENPSVRARLRAKGVAREGLIDRVDAEFTVELEGRKLELTAQTDLRGQRVLDVTGTSTVDIDRLRRGASSWLELPVALSATIAPYDLARLRDLRPQLETLEGRLEGQLEVSGTVGNPVAHTTAGVTGLRLGEIRFTRLALIGDVDRQRATAKIDAEQTAGGTLHLDGSVPIDADQPWQLALRARRFDLQFLSGTLSSLRSAHGTLEAQLDVGGTRSRPTPRGTVRVDNGSLQLRVEPHLYEKIGLEAQLRDGHLRLTRLAVTSGDGTLKASGDAHFDGLTLKRFDAVAQTQRFALVFGSLAAWLDSGIVVHGEGAAGRLHVRVTVDKGLVRLPKVVANRKLQAIGEPGHVTFVDRQARRAAAARAAAVDGEARQTSLTLHIPGPFYVRSREANAELLGDLVLVVNGPIVTLTGSAETRAGWIELLGRRYTIDKARVGFSGPPDNPDLDVQITRQLTEALLVVEVSGTAKQPRLALRSDPPIYDQSQLMGILLSGDPARQRVSDRSLDQKVVGAVSGLVLGKLKDAIAPKLPIDLIHIETGSSGYTGLGQTNVEVGKYLTENLYVSYVHQFGSTPSSVVTNSNEARVEYRFKRNFQLETTFGDAGVGGIDLYWIYRF